MTICALPPNFFLTAESDFVSRNFVSTGMPLCGELRMRHREVIVRTNFITGAIRAAATLPGAISYARNVRVTVRAFPPYLLATLGQILTRVIIVLI